MQALAAAAEHMVAGEPGLSQEAGIMPGDSDHVTDENNLMIFAAVCSTRLATIMTPWHQVIKLLLVNLRLIKLLLVDLRLITLFLLVLHHLHHEAQPRKDQVAQYQTPCNRLWVPFRTYMGPTFVLKTYFKEFRASGFNLSPLLLSTQLNLRLLGLNSTLMMRGSGTGIWVAGSNVSNADKLVHLKVDQTNIFRGKQAVILPF